MTEFKIPNFRLQKIYSDGTAEEPVIYELKDFDANWKMGRRQFLITTAIGLGLLSGLSGCITPEQKPLNTSTSAELNTSLEPEIVNGTSSENGESHRWAILDLCFSPNGKMLASGSYDGTIKLWEISSGQLLKTEESTSTVNSVSFSSDGTMLAAGLENNSIILWEMPSGQLLKIISGGSSRLAHGVTDVSFSPDVKMLASNIVGNGEDTIKLWEMPSGQLLKTLKENTYLTCAVFSPDGMILASGSSDETIKLWEMPSGQLLKTLESNSELVGDVSISPDGKMLASGSSDGTIKLWEVSSGQLLKTLEGHTDLVGDVSFSPDGKILASGSCDSTIKLWEVPSGQLLKTLKGHTDIVNTVCFSPDGMILASGSQDRTIKLWGMPEVKFLKNLIDPATLEQERNVDYNTPSTPSNTPSTSDGSNYSGGSYCTKHGGSYSYCTCNKICTCIPIK